MEIEYIMAVAGSLIGWASGKKRRNKYDP